MARGYRTYVGVRAPAVVAGGTVFAASFSDLPFMAEAKPSDLLHDLASFDPADGTERWRRELERPVESGLAVVDGRVHVGGVYGDGARDPTLRAFSTADGSLEWSHVVARDALRVSVPAVVDGTAYAAAGRHLVAVDARTGERRWRVEFDAELHHAQPAVTDDILVVAAEDGTLRAVDGDGDRAWRVDLGERVETGPVARDGVVYAAGSEALVAVEGGEVRWRFAPPGPILTRRAAVDDDCLYFGTRETGETPRSLVLAVSVDDGEVEWRRPGVDLRFVPPAVVGNAVLVGGHRGRSAWALDATDGAVRWRIDLPGPLLGRITVGAGRLFVPSSIEADGALLAYDPA